MNLGVIGLGMNINGCEDRGPSSRKVQRKRSLTIFKTQVFISLLTGSHISFHMPLSFVFPNKYYFL